MTLRIAVVVGELSGTALAVPLMTTLNRLYPGIQWMGIGSPEMVRIGFDAWFSSDCLSVIGFDIGKVIKQVWLARRLLLNRLLASPPDLFIGIDSPDFNFPLEKKLKKHGIPVVHIVSPSLWAWRKKRLLFLHHIMDHMVYLFPFEREIYASAPVASSYALHPLFHRIPIDCDRLVAREVLGFNRFGGKLIALMPGSRVGEVTMLLPVFIRAAQMLYKNDASLHFMIPAASDYLYNYCQSYLNRYAVKDVSCIHLFRGKSHEVMSAADVVVLASGTATLECALFKRPMVICYDLPPLSAWLARHLVKTPWVGLSNILLQKSLFPELLLEDCRADNVVSAVQLYLEDDEQIGLIERELSQYHRSLVSEGLPFAQSCAHILSTQGFLPRLS